MARRSARSGPEVIRLGAAEIRRIRIQDAAGRRAKPEPPRPDVDAAIRRQDSLLDELVCRMPRPLPAAVIDAFRARLNAPDPAIQASAFFYVASYPAHREAAIAWLERSLEAAPVAGFGASPAHGIAQLFESPVDASHERVRDAVARFLLRGPQKPSSSNDDWKGNATWRDLLADHARRLTAEELESVIVRALAALDGVDAHSRYVVWKHALPPFARAVGMRALDWVVMALQEGVENGLSALSALAESGGVDRPKVLAAVLPLLTRPEALRYPSYIERIAATLRALAGGQSPEALGVPRVIAKAWTHEPITEEGVLESLVEDGWIATRPVLESRGPSRFAGKDLVIEVLCRLKLAMSIDAESGSFPVPYATMLRDDLAPLLGEPVVSVETERAGDVATYRLALVAGDVGVATSISDSSDYYDIAACVALANALLEAQGSDRRVLSLETGDQTALLACGPPKPVRSFARRYRLRTAAAGA